MSISNVAPAPTVPTQSSGLNQILNTLVGGLGSPTGTVGSQRNVLDDIMSLGEPDLNRLVDGVFDRLASVNPQAAVGFAFAVRAGIGEAMAAPAEPAAPAAPAVDLSRLATDLSRQVSSARNAADLPDWINNVTSTIMERAADGASREEVSAMRSMLGDMLKPETRDRESVKAVFDAFVNAMSPEEIGADNTMGLTVMRPGNSIVEGVLRAVNSMVSDGELSRSDLGAVRDMVSDVIGAVFGDAAATRFESAAGGGIPNAGNRAPNPGGYDQIQPYLGNSGQSQFPGFNLNIDINGQVGGTTQSQPSNPWGRISLPGLDTGRPASNVVMLDGTRTHMQYLAGAAEATNFSEHSVRHLLTSASVRNVTLNDLAGYVGQDFVDRMTASMATRGTLGQFGLTSAMVPQQTQSDETSNV